MNFGLSEEQNLFRASLRRFVEERCPTSRVRAVMEGPHGHDAALWADLAGLGVTGLVVPVEYGGSGLELLDLALAADELGYGATPGPFLGNAIATVALRESGDARACERWLPRIASGEAVLTVAIGEDGAEWEPSRLATRAENGRLRGTKPMVPGASVADALIVAACDDDGPGLWIVEGGDRGLAIAPLAGVDATRRLDRVELAGVAGVKLADGARALARALDAGSVLIAADAWGGSRRCLDMTVAYVLEREQFGQPIGAFQAVKHQLANLACEHETALSLWWYAAHAFDRIPEAAPRHAAMAKALLCDLYDRVARECTELHGGIGFTWEYDLHLWFRRAVFDRGWLGEAAFHRERAAQLAGW